MAVFTAMAELMDVLSSGFGAVTFLAGESSVIVAIRTLKGQIQGFYFNAGLNVYEYPLVNIQKAIENGHRNSGFSH